MKQQPNMHFCWVIWRHNHFLSFSEFKITAISLIPNQLAVITSWYTIQNRA